MMKNFECQGGFLVDKQTAWSQFIKTGKIEDYLRYAGLQDTTRPFSEEEPAPDADNNRWIDNRNTTF